MSLVELLTETAEMDTEQLRTRDALGDDFALPRDVEFFLLAPSAEKAESAATFFNDMQYGVATAQDAADGKFGVLVVIHMPIRQHEILCVSAFMKLIGTGLELEYDGWGCVVEADA